MNKIVVFCGSSLGFNPVYRKTASDLGKAFAERNISMVFGGGKVGLMGVIAERIMSMGGEVIGIIPEILEQEEVIYREISKVIVTKTMSERKVAMSKLADAYITLPGGFGTLDELFEALTLNQLHIEEKPVGLLNINGYFDATIEQLDKMVEEGFLQPENQNLLLFDETIEGLLNQMEVYKAPIKRNVINKVVRNDN